MSLVGFHARNHPQQKRNPSVDDRKTPWDFFLPLHEKHQFTVDVAASIDNHKLPRFYTMARSGLVASWKGERVWCNPPYSDIQPWVEKAWESTLFCPVIVMLLPANRTEQGWWQDLVEPHRDNGGHLSVEFLRGRLRFVAATDNEVKPGSRPPFGCCLLTWRTKGLEA